MKEKIKQIILYFMIFYTIIITIMLIINITTSTKYIELSDSEDNLIKLNELKQELTKLEQNDCTNSINNLIDIYKKTSYNGQINLIDYYNQESFTSYFQKTKEMCQITDNEFQQYNLLYNIATNMIINEAIHLDYMYQYQIHIPDIIWGDTKSILTYNKYSIIKHSEITTISDLIDLIKERNETHE